MTGIIDFYDICISEGIKPIIGNELYFTYNIDVDPQQYDLYGWDKKNYHIIVLAKNETGYRNLIKLSSVAATKGKYAGCERVDLKTLNEYREGLVVSSACLGGIIQNRIQDWYNYNQNPEAFQEKKKSKSKKKAAPSTEPVDNIMFEMFEAKNKQKTGEDYLQDAYYFAEEFKKIFRDDFYLELQTTTEPMQRVVNEKLIEMSRELSIPLIATCDVHYAKEDDWDFHDSLICVSTKKLKSDTDRMHYQPCYFVMTEDEVRSYLDYLPKDAVDEAINNTQKIADQCNVKIEYGKIPFPKIDLPKGMTPEKYMEKLAYNGLYVYALKEDIDIEKYQKQLDYELDTICKAGFAPYFLVVRDYIIAANTKCNCITGPGRGSAAGSLVTFFLGITKNIDPIKNGLLFERFLNNERIEMPDVDTDFEYVGRARVMDYLYDKYGRDHVAKVMTITWEGIKIALKDAARVLGYDHVVINELVKKLPVLKKSDVDVDDYNEDKITPECIEVLEEIKTKYRDVYDLAMRLYGMPRSYGVHASGVLIAGEPILNTIPLKAVEDKDTGEMNIVAQYDHGPVELLGGIKFDLLGLKTLSILEYAKQLVGDYIDLDSINFEDPNLYRTIRDCITEGIFQLESNMFKGIIKEMAPSCFNDISALVALGRPGPLGAGLVDRYVRRKRGLENIEYDFDSLKEIESDTFGVFVYQEQLMMAAQILCGYTLGQADLGIRKPMAKKKMDLVNENRRYFVYGKAECPNCKGKQHKEYKKKGPSKDFCAMCEGTGFITAIQNKEMGIHNPVIIPGGINVGYSEDALNNLYDKMEFFGSYAFNRSHSACYAVISLQTAYMKTYHPAEFMASTISFAKDIEEIGFYIEHARKIGLRVLPPDINKSDTLCTVENGDIRIGFGLIKGVSSGASYIIDERKNGNFKSFDDFYNRINRTKVNKTKVDALIKAGCFKGISDMNTHQLINHYMTIKGEKNYEPISSNVTKKELAMYEEELFGTRIEQISAFEQKKEGASMSSTGIIKAVRTLTDKRGREMCFMTVDTKDGEIECVVFATIYQKAKDTIAQDRKIQIKGKKDQNKLLIDSVKIA